MIPTPVLTQTASGEYPGITIRFVLGRGVVADWFPREAIILDEQLVFAREHKGIIWVQGNGIGARVTLSLQNGHAIYELTDRAILTDGSKAFRAERRSFKPCIAGKPVEVKSYGLADVGKLMDEWPEVVAFKADMLNPPQELAPLVRVRNSGERAQFRFRTADTEALYTAYARYPGDKDVVWIAERVKLQTRFGQWVRIPAAVYSSAVV